MTETRFTPGPWRVEYGTTLVWGNCDREDQSSRGMGYPVAEARITPAGSWTTRPEWVEGEANAHLIAAAPELYEALKTVRDYVDDANDGAISYPDGEPIDKSMTGDDLKRIDATLAKARGEQS